MEPEYTYNNLGLPPEWRGALEWVFPEWARMHALDKGETVNFLKGAIVTADRILTVSKVMTLITYCMFCFCYSLSSPKYKAIVCCSSSDIHRSIFNKHGII